MGSAAMDRLVHRGIKIVIEGKSYRVESFRKRSAGYNPLLWMDRGKKERILR
jgi:hypothetical protein